jgi:heme oxygenase
MANFKTVQFKEEDLKEILELKELIAEHYKRYLGELSNRRVVMYAVKALKEELEGK